MIFLINVLRETDHRNPLLARLGWVLLFLFVLLLALLPFDSAVITGETRWLKPAKFAISISVYFLTMAWFLGELKRWRWMVGLITLSIAVAMLTEQSLITMQAARGITSHFNYSTEFDATVFSIMGYGVILNTLVCVVAFLLFVMYRNNDKLAYIWGIRLGLLVFILGSIEGYVMVERGAHTVGAIDGGPGIAILHWSKTHGDLRWAHFLGIHALQALPVAGWFIDKLSLGPWSKRISIWVCAIAWVGLTWWAFANAMAGLPGL